MDKNGGEAGNVVFGRETAGDEVGRVLAVISKRLCRIKKIGEISELIGFVGMGEGGF